MEKFTQAPVGLDIDQTVSSNSTAIAKVQNGLAFIVGNTNTTGGTLAVGQFVYVKGHSTIDEGLRTVTASISANGSITTSNTSACSEGGLNALNSKLTPANKAITPVTGYSWNSTTFTKIGNICFLSINGAQGNASTGWTTVATVPSDCKPYALAYSVIVDDATMETKEMRITTDGELQIWGVNQSHLHWGEIIWVSNT